MAISISHEELINKVALVSIEYFDKDRHTLLNEKRVYGTVNVAGEEHGIGMILKDKTHFALPLSLDAWQPAPPGIYEDEKTGEEIINPDFLVTWKVYRTQDERKDGDHEWWSWEPA